MLLKTVRLIALFLKYSGSRDIREKNGLKNPLDYWPISNQGLDR
jgi:hypothetical protein